MFNESPIISVDEFKGIANVSSALNTAKSIDIHVLNAQRLDVAPIIGDVLMVQLAEFNNAATPAAPTPEEAALIHTLEGGAFTYNNCNKYHYGLKRAVAYYALARYYKAGAAVVTPSGVKDIIADYAEKPSNNELNRMANQFINDAAKYLEGTLDYLKSVEDTLTNFNYSKPYQEQKAGLKIYTSSGRTKAPKYGDSFRFDYD